VTTLDELERLLGEATAGPIAIEGTRQNNPSIWNADGRCIYHDDYRGFRDDAVANCLAFVALRNSAAALIEVARAAESLIRESAIVPEMSDKYETYQITNGEIDALRAALARLEGK
jgi:hypothetical protein